MLVNDLLSLGQNALAQIEYYCNINCMKAGIIYSDAVTTVSPTYAKEICTPRCGETLDGLLRHKHIAGILNGIDKKLYNPWTVKLFAAVSQKISRRANKNVNPHSKRLWDLNSRRSGLLRR